MGSNLLKILIILQIVLKFTDLLQESGCLIFPVIFSLLDVRESNPGYSKHSVTVGAAISKKASRMKDISNSIKYNFIFKILPKGEKKP